MWICEYVGYANILIYGYVSSLKLIRYPLETPFAAAGTSRPSHKVQQSSESLLTCS
jgi:hypothetical protein